MNALNVTLSSQFLTNLIEIKQLCVDYREELSRLTLVNKTGMKILLKAEQAGYQELLGENEVTEPKIIEVAHQQTDKNKSSEKGVFADTIWIVELGLSKRKLIQERQMSIYEIDQLNLSRRIGSMSNQANFFKQNSDYEGLAAHQYESGEDFASMYRPLQDISFKTTGERCFMLLDKKGESSGQYRPMGRDQQTISDNGLFVILDVSNSKNLGVKKITFGSQVEIRSEVPFEVKIVLEAEGLDNTIINLNREQSKMIPVMYCTQDTSMMVFGSVDRVASLDEGGVDSEIKFQAFYVEGNQFSNTNSYYLNE